MGWGTVVQAGSQTGAWLTRGLSVPAAWPRYRVVGSADTGQYNLEITDAELSDDASYECQATEAALRSRRAKLTVLSNDRGLCLSPGLPATPLPVSSRPSHFSLSFLVSRLTPQSPPQIL